ncbi:MAG: class I SAM-dependent methyltransferase, partial [bacterium]|nr:class I SAM-dependent methyltransferase [bacterium]
MEKEPKFDIKKTYMSDRSVFDYMDKLEVSEEELDDPDALIIDLGSGTKQNLSREAREFGLKSKIISIDPRLGLDAKEDLELPLSSKRDRKQGRANPEPYTLAGLGQALPIKNESVHRIFALYSVPYYLENQDEIEDNLSEMIRVLKPGGVIRIFPIMQNQLSQVEDFLKKQKNIKSSFSLKESGEDSVTGEKIEDWLLIIEKEKNT